MIKQYKVISFQPPVPQLRYYTRRTRAYNNNISYYLFSFFFSYCILPGVYSLRNVQKKKKTLKIQKLVFRSFWIKFKKIKLTEFSDYISYKCNKIMIDNNAFNNIVLSYFLCRNALYNIMIRTYVRACIRLSVYRRENYIIQK